MATAVRSSLPSRWCMNTTRARPSIPRWAFLALLDAISGTDRVLCVRRRRGGGARTPIPPDLSQRRRVHEHVPKRRDRGHVGGPEPSVWLHQDGHLAAVAA